MQVLAIGFGLLILVLLGGRWFATASPASVARVLKWGGLAAAVLLLIVVLRTGILPLIFAAIAALLPWLMRALHLHALIRQLRSSFGGAAGWRNAGAASQPESSQVETAWLRMRLDHESGALDGLVLAGTWSGRPLAALTPEELAGLWREVQADAQSVQLLESWLDRNHPDWRGGMDAPGAPRPEDGGAMTAEEARAVLGLEPGADAAAVKAAHRRLMMACHPDHGGSDWLAARINRAKEVLLAEAAR